jgi:molybdenum cofactor biosynthesis enzyme MoaA
MAISSDCSEDYMNKVYKHLKTLGFETFAEITQDIYPQVLNGMKKNAELQNEKNG